MGPPDAAHRSDIVRFAQFEVDLRSGELRRSGVRIRLQDQPFRLLRILLEHPGELVTRDELQRQIWPSDTFVDFDRGLNNAVKRLREALRDTAESPRYIETLPKRGYRFIGELYDVEPSGTATTHVAGLGTHTGTGPPDADGPRPVLISDARAANIVATRQTHRAGRVVFTVLLAILVLIAIGVALNAGGLRDRLFHKTDTAIQAGPIHSIAVIPLTSLSGDQLEDHLSDGITDAIITSLAQIHAITVISRTSVTPYKKTTKPLREIAHDLGVDGIVEGTIQHLNNRIRISAQLLRGASDDHLWAKSFEYDAKDLLELQNTVAGEIARDIEMTLAERTRLPQVGRVNPRVLDAYLNAQHHIDRACAFRSDMEGQNRSAELQQAYFYLDRAIEQDPTYRPAYLEYFQALDNASPHLPFEYLSKAKSSLIKGIELGDEDLDGHIEMAKLLMRYEYDWAGAEREYKRGIEVNPSSGYAHFAYSEYLANVGRSDEAAAELKQAQAFSPAHDYQNDHFAVLQRADRSLEQQRRALEEQSPDNPFVVMIMAKNYAIAGRFQESAEMWERCLRLYGRPDFADILRKAKARGDGRFALEEWMRAVEDYSKGHDDFPVAMAAFTYSSLGNSDRAFAWLDKAVDERHWCLPFLRRDNVWNPLRSDPRFAKLLDRVGLPH